jgi:hypothetical protein
MDAADLASKWDVLKAIRKKGAKIKITGGPIQKDDERKWKVEVTNPKIPGFIPAEITGCFSADRPQIVCVAAVVALGIKIGQPTCCAEELLRQVVPEGEDEERFIRYNT